MTTSEYTYSILSFLLHNLSIIPFEFEFIIDDMNQIKSIDKILENLETV